MISYAQNNEDVILDRALHADTGFYVDVGAASPTIASVTKHFYDLGWSGINVEPLSTYVTELRQERPRDITVEAVAGAVPGRRTFYIVDADPDLSTLDVERQGELSADGEQTTPYEVEVVTLDHLLEEANPTTIDFLKIDVEGAEREVLEGLDLARWRPRVLVVESTAPNAQVPTHQLWEDLVTGRGYRYASFDGINRYYVPEEESSLVGQLGPANVLDHFQPASVVLLDEEIDRLRTYVAKLELEIFQKNEQMAICEGYARELEGLLAAHKRE